MTDATFESGEWQREPRRRRFGWLLVIIAVTVAVVLGGVFPFRQMIAQQSQVANTQEKLATLEEENADLAAEVAGLQTPAEIERIAREELGLVRPGETSFTVDQIPGPTSEATPPAVEPSAGENRSFFAKVWDFFTGRDLVPES